MAQAVLILPRQPSEPYKRWGYLWQEGFLNEFTEMGKGERLVLSPSSVPARKKPRPLCTENMLLFLGKPLVQLTQI